MYNPNVTGFCLFLKKYMYMHMYVCIYIYIEGSVSSTENDINTLLVKAWTAIDKPIGHLEIRPIR